MQDSEHTQSYVNDSETSSPTRTELTQRRSRPVRYRIIGADGKRWPPFSVKPGVKLADVLPAGAWDLEALRDVQIVGAGR